MKEMNKMKKILLCLFGATLLSSTAMGAEKIFSYKGKVYSNKNLNSKARQAVHEAEMERFKNIGHIADGVVLEEHIKSIAKKQKKSESVVAQEILKTAPPTEKEMKEWFEKNKHRIPYPFEKVKNEISRMLSGEQSNKKRAELLADLKKKNGFKLMLKEPIAPVFKIDTKGFPSKGNDKAKLVLVEFADYQCPHCKQASELMAKVVKKYADKVKLVYMDWPFNKTGISRKVAEGSYCAEKQGKYWEYHEKAFAMQKELSNDSPVKLAKDLKLDVKKFETCLASDAAKNRVQKSWDLGNDIGVSGTPSFYLNGKKLEVHAHSVDEWGEILKAHM